MVSVIIHAKNSSIDSKERPIQTPSYCSVEIFSFIFRHFKYNFSGIFYSTGLEETIRKPQTSKHKQNALDKVSQNSRSSMLKNWSPACPYTIFYVSQIVQPESQTEYLRINLK